TVITRCACTSENHRRPACQRGPSGNANPSTRTRGMSVMTVGVNDSPTCALLHEGALTMNTRCSCRNNDNKARRFVVGMHSVRRAHALMFTAALAIVLGGCGSSNGSGSQAAAVNDGTQGPQLESRPAEARRAGAPIPRDLAFLRYAIDVSR